MITPIENKMDDKLTEKIIGCCYKIHNELGPGFSEKIYHNSLKILFDEEKLKYETEKIFVVNFHESRVGMLRVDLIVKNKVIIEIKAVTGKVPIVFKHQVLSYLKISGLKVGLLINFGNKSCEVNRFVN